MRIQTAFFYLVLLRRQAYNSTVEWDLDSCRQAYDERRLRQWIEEYLQVPEWENLGLLRRMREFGVYWSAPVLMPIAGLSRVAGPGPEYKFPQDPIEWERKVNAIAIMRPTPDHLPPVIAWRDPDGSVNLADGNHRVAALEKLGYEYVWALVHNEPLRSDEELRTLNNPSARVAVPKPMDGELAELADEFRNFAHYCKDNSELYQYLSNKIAEDEEILALANLSQTGQPVPNLLFGAVHYLLMKEKTHALTRYYPSLSLEPESPEQSFPAFRKYCQSHFDKIAEILETRLVQTNEVMRSAFLFPAFLAVKSLFGDKPFSMIEIGASAGFNLLWDHYAYQYEDLGPFGLLSSSLTLTSSFRGDRRPDFSIAVPTISNRVGFDLNPIDLMNQDEVQWLQALIWPEHFERKARLNKAIRIAMVNPVQLIKGDATVLVGAQLATVPETEVAVVYHTFVANQMSPEQRSRLLATIDEFGQRQDVVHIHNSIEADLRLHATVYRGGERIEMPLADTDGHARWIEWLA